MSDDTALAQTFMPDGEITTVMFRIGPQYYALPLGVVQEVVHLAALLSVAGAPAHLAGLLNLRGRFLPVLDGYMLLDEAGAYDLSSQIILVGSGGEGHNSQGARFGLLVDQVCDVIAIPSNQLSPLGTQAASFLAAVATVERAVTLLNVAALEELTST